jgi:hypothetical protein
MMGVWLFVRMTLIEPHALGDGPVAIRPHRLSEPDES